MADIRRTNYYDSKFLVEKDFNDEQNYHMDMRRRHNRVLHTAGIATGLNVTQTLARQVSISAGTAIDVNGREVVLLDPKTFDLPTFPPGTTAVFLTIEYQDLPDPNDPDKTPGLTNKFRSTIETPKVDAKTTEPSPSGLPIALAKLKLDAISGNITAIDPLVRRKASAVIDPATLPPTGIASINGVSSPGGNIDLVAAAGKSITFAPDAANRRIAIGHNIIPAEIGALATSQYDLGRRDFASALFNQGNADGAERSLPVGFAPKVILCVGHVRGVLGNRTYGGPVSALVDNTQTLRQRGNGFFVMRIDDTNWFASSDLVTDGVCAITLQAGFPTPTQREIARIFISSIAAPNVVLKLSRATVGNPLNFEIKLELLCLGSL
jgi:hypothetical protein